MCAKSSSDDSLLVAIDGFWYDLTYWKKHHPGGELILQHLHKQDATDAFYSIHSDAAIQRLKRMKPVVREDLEPPIPTSETEQLFRAFRLQLIEEGWFKRNWFWDALNVGLIFFLAIFGSIIAHEHPFLAIASIGMSMQQAGWSAHDYVHGRGSVSWWLGRLIGTFINGFSSTWWSHKHNTHHVYTNTIDVDEDVMMDPWLHLWIPAPNKDYWIRRIQHLYLYPVLSLLYVSWRVQSLQCALGRKIGLEIFLISINYAWLATLPFWVAFGSILLSGFLVAIIVTATHQSEEIFTNSARQFSFVEDQFRTTRDAICWNFLDHYLWGGMQFQLEHHLFPTMPRYRYGALVPRVKEFAAKTGLHYRTSDALQLMLMNFHTIYSVARESSHKVPDGQVMLLSHSAAPSETTFTSISTSPKKAPLLEG